LEFISGTYNECEIKDLSLTGMFVFGSFAQKENDKCVVHYCQKGKSTDVCLQAMAEVVRVTEDGIAIEFTEMTFDSYMYLEVVLLYEARQPLVIGLELPDDSPFRIIEEKPTLPK
jgi:hypothetical protein